MPGILPRFALTLGLSLTLLTGAVQGVFAPTAALAIDSEMLAGMSARSVGPAGMSGRIAAVEGVPSNPSIMYVGAATGGLWKSIDGGLTFNPIFDDQPVAAIGAVAAHPLYPDIVWVGTGEGNLRNSVSVGNGIYKSMDGGENWEYLGLPESERVHRILLHPTDSDVAYVAVPGKLWGDSTERGVFKTTDGGKTWNKILYVNEKTGCGDLIIDPSNPDRLIAAMYEFRRWPWSFHSGGPGSGLYRTLDGGKNWEEITPEDGLPKGDLGRCGLAYAPSNPKIVYAYVEAEKNQLMRSEDGGKTWSTRSTDRNIGNRPFYYADIRVDPKDSNRVYSLWSFVSVSNDGGKNWEMLIPWAKLHPDHHAMWIDPNNPNYIIEGNDGGVGISYDRGDTWRFVTNLPLAQFYHIAVDMDVPYNIYGGMQDNGSWRGPSSVWENGGIRNHHWEEVGFGDGFDTQPDPRDSMQGYAMSQEGYLSRWNLRTGERRAIRPAAAEGDSLRFNWNAGLAQDPFDASTIYFGSQYVHKSTNRGNDWSIISPDLTTNREDWQKQAESGGLTPDVTGAENFTSILTIAPSPLNRDVIWVGTDDGRIHVTRDGGLNWESLEDKVRGVPDHTWVPHIDPSHHDEGTAFVVFDDHRRSNMTPYVQRVENFGKRWTNLATSEIDGYCLVIEQDHVNPDLLFLGTEFGLYVSTSAGKSWMKWTHGVPTCSVMDLVVHPREHDLILGTHGRAAFVLDDIRPLRTISDATMAKKLHVFEIPDAMSYTVKQTGASRFPGATEFRGRNKPYGAMITFSLNDPDLPHPDEDIERDRKISKRAEKAAEKASGKKSSKKKGDKGGMGKPGRGGNAKPKVMVEIKDDQGEVIREFERNVTQGVNRIVWRLESDPFKRPPTQGPNFFGGGGRGPEVLPGTYEVTLKYGDAEETQNVKVLADPRTQVSRVDRQASWDARQRAGAVQELVAEAVKRMEDTKSDIDFVLNKIKQIERDEKEAAEAEEAEGGDPEDSEGDDGEGEDKGEDENDPLKKLKKDGQSLKKALANMDKRLRRDRNAKGIPGGSNIMGELGTAQWFLGSTDDRPSSSVMGYLEHAERMMQDFLVDYNKFYDEDVREFRQAAEAANFDLFPSKDALKLDR